MHFLKNPCLYRNMLWKMVSFIHAHLFTACENVQNTVELFPFAWYNESSLKKLCFAVHEKGS